MSDSNIKIEDNVSQNYNKIKDFENQVRNLNILLNIEKDNSKNLEMMIQNMRVNQTKEIKNLNIEN